MWRYMALYAVLLYAVCSAEYSHVMCMWNCMWYEALFVAVRGTACGAICGAACMTFAYAVLYDAACVIVWSCGSLRTDL